MIKFAIAGNIASGKTTVENFLKEKGYEVLDTDKIGHEILDSEVRFEIIKTFEGQDISDNGKIDRQKLGQLVFANYNERKKLENIVHPIIRKRIEEYFTQKQNEKFAFIAIPLVFEAKMEDMFDKIIFIFADDEVRLERLMKRNNLSEKDAMMRINSQMSQFMKLEESDYAFHNNTTVENLQTQVNQFCKQILEKM